MSSTPFNPTVTVYSSEKSRSTPPEVQFSADKKKTQKTQHFSDFGPRCFACFFGWGGGGGGGGGHQVPMLNET